ncbi:hypothetical protein JKF63_03557 [Porcisia hertigi]|uniref:Uncharacterized protein n=1 Tax=Porcisia hertigi TaxID=2761500 RepID=A0A836L6T1_9TRYP|nr:hypothetical protein JKF63_03557 [Porcisia hertigi]
MERYSDGSYTSSETHSVRTPGQRAQRADTDAAYVPRNEEQGNRIHYGGQSSYPETSGEVHGNERAGGNTAQKKGPEASSMEKTFGKVNRVFCAQRERARATVGSLTNSNGQQTTIYIFFYIACIHLLFVILSSTLSQLDMKGGGCYTFWGFKADCDRVSYTTRTSLMGNCAQLRSSLQAGAAFSILSILASAVAVTASWILCCRIHSAASHAQYTNVDETGRNDEAANPSSVPGNGENKRPANAASFDTGHLKTVIAVVVVVSLVFELICWTLIACIYTNRYCDDTYFWFSEITYGPGFGLGLTAWLMELIAYVVFLVVV